MARQNPAVQRPGRARRKQGNYTSYGQTGGTLAPSGRPHKRTNGGSAKTPGPAPAGDYTTGLVFTPGGTFREPRDPKPYVTTGDNFGRGNSHGVAIVRGDGVFGGGRKPRPVNPYGSDGPGVNRPGAYDLGDSYGVAPGRPKNGPTKGPRKHGRGGSGGIVSLGGRPGNKKRRPKKPSYLTGGNNNTRLHY